MELSEGVSINDLRKNLHLLNEYMEQQCRSTPGRYGIELDAALITTIDPPAEVDRALSAINSTRNQVAADISTARADAEQQITMSKRAVEIAANNAHAEVAPLRELAAALAQIKGEGGTDAIKAYLRNMPRAAPAACAPHYRSGGLVTVSAVRISLREMVDELNWHHCTTSRRA